jgi:hypothetical protein
MMAIYILNIHARIEALVRKFLRYRGLLVLQVEDPFQIS